MALPPAPTSTDLEIVVPIFVGIAIIVSAVRLTDRGRSGRFGLDDLFCTISACAVLGLVTCIFLLLHPPANIDTSKLFIAYYGNNTLFLVVVWMARISLIQTAVRIAAFRAQKYWLHGLAAVNGTAFLVLVAQAYWICEREPGWKTATPPQCTVGSQRAITEICLDISSDIALVLVPVHFLRKASLEKSVFIRLVLLFSTSIFITIVSLVHDVFVLVVGGTRELMAACLEAAIALIVCSIPVVGTALYRSLSGQRERGSSHDRRTGSISDPSRSPHSRRTNHFGLGTFSNRSHRPPEGLPADGVLVQHELTFRTDSPSVGKGVQHSDDDLSRIELQDHKDIGVSECGRESPVPSF